MSALITDISVLQPTHRHALQLHLLSLSADDRYQRFGATLTDVALVHWVRGLAWPRSHWYGAWSGADAGLLGAMQLIALNSQQGVWEMALTVTPVARRLGVGSALFSDLMVRAETYPILELVCQNGHPAVRRMAEFSKLVVCCQTEEPRMRMKLSVGSS
jgi:GNAT superfamily N-acetyltransferase